MSAHAKAVEEARKASHGLLTRGEMRRAVATFLRVWADVDQRSRTVADPKHPCDAMRIIADELEQP